MTDDRSSDASPRDIVVREATAADLPDVLGVLDAAALETDHDRVRDSVERGGTLVAVRSHGSDAPGNDGEPAGGQCDDGPPDRGPVVGALVLVGEEIDAVAVRRGRRARGIGTALVEAAAGRRDRLVAEFDGGVRPFYESLGFEVQPVGDGRFRGRRSGE